MKRSELGRSLNLKIDTIPEGRPNRPGSPLHAKKITVHNTDNANAGADAEAHANFVSKVGYYVLNGKRHYISWHYTVDDDSCVRHLPLNEVGYHAGSRMGNASSLGVEICMNRDIDQSMAFTRAQKLLACLCYDMGLDPLEDVVTHHHWSGKTCPRLLLEANGKPGAKWEAFLQGIATIVDQIENG